MQCIRYLQPLLQGLTDAGRFVQAPAVAGGTDGKMARYWALLGGVGAATVDTWRIAAPAPAGEQETTGAAPTGPAVPAAVEWWLRPAFQVGGEPAPPYIMVARFIAEARGARWEKIKALMLAASLPAEETDGSSSDDESESEDGTGSDLGHDIGVAG